MIIRASMKNNFASCSSCSITCRKEWDKIWNTLVSKQTLVGRNSTNKSQKCRDFNHTALVMIIQKLLKTYLITIATLFKT